MGRSRRQAEGMSPAWKGEAPAEPRMSRDAQSHRRLSRSFALPENLGTPVQRFRD